MILWDNQIVFQIPQLSDEDTCNFWGVKLSVLQAQHILSLVTVFLFKHSL